MVLGVPGVSCREDGGSQGWRGRAVCSVEGPSKAVRGGRVKRPAPNWCVLGCLEGSVLRPWAVSSVRGSWNPTPTPRAAHVRRPSRWALGALSAARACVFSLLTKSLNIFIFNYEY